MTEITQPAVRINPLLSVLRQPKIYIRLPSNGKYWKEGSLNVSVNGEYPVFSMTARDELLLKTPDALMNGQAMVEIIHSCMPNVLDAWDCPQVDLDTILVAVRLATYGEMLTMKITHPTIDGDTDYEINVREVLENLQSQVDWDDRFEISPELVVYLKPLTYRSQTDAQIGEFDTQRLISIIKDDNTSEQDKIKAFQAAFQKLTSKTITIIGQAIYRIESIAGVVEDPEFITEFIEKCDSAVFEKIKDRLGVLNLNNQLKPMTIQSTPEMLEKGAPPTIEVPFTFNEANFFV